MRGKFISLEGGEGVGKSTQAKALAEALRERGIDVVETREPGGSPGAEAIRALLLQGEIERWTAETEALLFAAARAELVAQVIRPALERGQVVVSDRFLDSSLAYQGGARGLGIDDVELVNSFATRGLKPDLTILLELSPEEAAARAGESDRFEDEGAGLQEAVGAAYEHLMEADPERWRRIDATRSPDEVHADVLAAVREARSA